jgi:hypothetical protein
MIFDITNRYVQFSISLSASILSTIFTVAIVDKLLKKSEEKKNVPLKCAVYEDVRLFIVEFINFWQGINIAASESHTAVTIDILFESNYFEGILHRLNLDKSPNITPKNTWWYWINKESIRYSLMLDKIFNRYSTVVDPEIFKALHYLAEEDPMLMCLRDAEIIHQSDIRKGFFRPKYLAAYLVKTNENFFSEIKNIYYWCVKEKSTLKKFGYEVSSVNYTLGVTNTHYDSRFSDEEYDEQNRLFSEEINKKI